MASRARPTTPKDLLRMTTRRASVQDTVVGIGERRDGCPSPSDVRVRGSHVKFPPAWAKQKWRWALQNPNFRGLRGDDGDVKKIESKHVLARHGRRYPL